MAAPARALSGDMDISEFLRFVRPRPKEENWQLVEGVAVMMNPPRLVHQMISANLRDLLNRGFEQSGHDLVALQEIGVRVRSVANFLPRPDVAVISGIAGDELYADSFRLVAEVLSPSNTRGLIVQKLRRYQQHPENLYCLVIDSRRVWLQVHARRNGWQSVTLEQSAATLDLPELGLHCALGDLYRRTPLDPRRPGPKQRRRSR